MLFLYLSVSAKKTRWHFQVPGSKKTAASDSAAQSPGEFFSTFVQKGSVQKIEPLPSIWCVLAPLKITTLRLPILVFDFLDPRGFSAPFVQRQLIERFVAAGGTSRIFFYSGTSGDHPTGERVRLLWWLTWLILLILCFFVSDFGQFWFKPELLKGFS